MMVLMYNIRSGTIRWQMPDFLSDVNSNVCIFSAFTCQNRHFALSLTIFEIFANQAKYNNLILKMKVKFK